MVRLMMVYRHMCCDALEFVLIPVWDPKNRFVGHVIGISAPEPWD
uniref:Uncharacterized protein n=1 Tax=Arundo donax TaxID=35708 RepID=A0A0A9H0T5_ARUDO